MGDWLRKDGQTVMGLLEWTTAAPNIGAYLVVVEERVPTDGNRPEEIHTLKVDGFFSEGPRPPTDLRDVLLKVPKPSGDDRRALSRIIATQVRSLYVHFQLYHMALRTDSFVFFGDAEKPDLTKPYVLDWTRPSSP
jgi:hypothetical protein